MAAVVAVVTNDAIISGYAVDVPVTGTTSLLMSDRSLVRTPPRGGRGGREAGERGFPPEAQGNLPEPWGTFQRAGWGNRFMAGEPGGFEHHPRLCTLSLDHSVTL